MIKAILIFNNHGKPRLNKFYQYYNESQQQQIIKETFQVEIIHSSHFSGKMKLKLLLSLFPREMTMFATSWKGDL